MTLAKQKKKQKQLQLLFMVKSLKSYDNRSKFKVNLRKPQKTAKMGGCRCTFRSCTVNTLKNPGMHFFHYPVKHEERLEEWIKYTQYSEFKKLLPTQAKNKVVCALHFRDEHFMNYKKDRLVPHAVPTLERLKNGMVLDYSLSDHPTAMFLPPPTEKHLIPPKGYRQLGLPDDYFLEEGTLLEVLEEEEVLSEQPVKRLKLSENTQTNNMGMTANQSKGTTDKVKTPISFSVARYEVEQYSGKGELTIDSLTPSATNHNAMLINLNDIECIPEEEVCDDVDYSIKKEVHEHALATVETLHDKLQELQEENEKQKSEANSKIAQLELELANAKKRIIAECSKSDMIRTAAKKLQEKIEELEAANQKLTNAAKIAVKKPSTASVSTGQLTKPQLFNGIKKYMTASMTSLVRMEVFGGPEREWKKDEKQVSVELLRLGEKVYDYISEEWRFRLPPKKIVNEWMHEDADEDEEDL